MRPTVKRSPAILSVCADVWRISNRSVGRLQNPPWLESGGYSSVTGTVRDIKGRWSSLGEDKKQTYFQEGAAVNTAWSLRRR
ncbi:uncharacterized protein zgc:113176 isoform X2 [Oreochromis aureus]|uniref:uncharacterized protein zgc:113176 isoform X2 n=1 Tax=Oreochromis aureus TaxID=47969 RepID=UPI001952F1A3|nr:uncharacterized protein zgc:113176 isoform X2 [Oreochromis aureus]